MMGTIRHAAHFSLLLALCNNAIAAESDTARRPFHIASQPLTDALTDFARQSGLRVVRRDAAASADISTPEVIGDITPDEALARLLARSGWTHEFVDERTVRIRQASLSPTSSTRPPEPLRLAQTSSPSARPPSDSDASDGILQVVVVTAQKRLERLQDVPVPVTAVSGDLLVAKNQLRLQDFYASVPGLNLISSSKGDAFISIRGVTTGATSGNPTVGITIDDVPYGPSSTYGAGGLGVPAPDIDPSDLAQIEVLRGPQGTLYGASSIGGLLKYVTADPSLDGLRGRLQASMSTIKNSDEMGYTLRGNLNAPLSDTFAIRASAFDRRDPGYVDDPARAAEDVNRIDVFGGRLGTLWQVSDAFLLKLNALYQEIEGHGSPDVDLLADLGDLQQNKLRGTGAYKKKAEFYSAIATAQLGDSELTSLTSYGINTDQSSLDFTPAFGEFALNGVPGSGFDGFGVPGASLVNDFQTRKFTQEVRLSTPMGERADWLLGLFYTRENSRVAQQLYAVNADTGAQVGQFLDARWPTRFTEYAAFTNLTWRFTDRFDVQFGARHSQNRQTYSEIDSGLYGPVFFGLPDPIVNPPVKTKDDSFTYLITPRVKLTPEIMVYARLASGYRAGGPNPTSTVFGLPASFAPDKTQNYELGAKAEFFDRRLAVDSSLYYIDWKDIQLNVFDPVSAATYFENGSRAKSQGLELAFDLTPMTGLKLNTWASFNQAELTESFPVTATLFGVKGDRLPNSAKVTAHFSIDHQIPVGSTLQAEYGASVDYVGDRKGVFVSTGGPPERQTYPSYAQLNLRAGLSRAPLALNLFVTNATDKRGAIAGGLGTFNPIAFTYIQPRTIGLSVSWDFAGETP